MFSIDRMFEVLQKDFLYEENLVSYIDSSGKQHCSRSFSDIISRQNVTVKIEGLERFNRKIFQECQRLSSLYVHKGPVTCHLFYSRIGSPSFGLHTDPDDVVIQCIEGKKSMEINGKKIILDSGERVYIPEGRPHRALNEFESLIFSFGLERFLEDKMNELDVLSQNDRDL